MTKRTDNKEVQGIKASQTDLLKWLESELWLLINDQSSWLSDLASFSKNLTHKKAEKPLTKHNLRLIKEDLQDGGLVDFESGNRNWVLYAKWQGLYMQDCWHQIFKLLWWNVHTSISSWHAWGKDVQGQQNHECQRTLLLSNILETNW